MTVFKEFFLRLRKNWQLLIYLPFVLGALSFFISTLLPFYYRSQMTFLIMEERNWESQFTSSTLKYYTEVLSQLIYSDSFIHKIGKTSYVLEDDIPFDDKARRRFWQKKIDIKKETDLGFLEVVVLGRSKKEAENFSWAIAETLPNSLIDYFGESSSLRIKLIGEPFVSQKPVKPDIWKNLEIGLIVGLVGALILILVFDDLLVKIFERRKMVTFDFEQKVKQKIEAEIKYGLQSNNSFLGKSIKEGELCSLAEVNYTDKIEDKNASEILSKKEEERAIKPFIIKDKDNKDNKEKIIEFEDVMEPTSSNSAEEFFNKRKEKSFNDRGKKQQEESQKNEPELILRNSWQNYYQQTKAAPPDNLPFFEEKEEKEKQFNEDREKTNQSLEKIKQPGEEKSEKGLIGFYEDENENILGNYPKKGVIDRIGDESFSKEEISEEEVKEKLNRLLRGEI